MKTLSRDLRTRALHETATPVALDAAAFPGATVLGDDGRVYTSIRWPTPADPYSWQSAAQVAEDIAADVPRILTAETKITVDRTTPEVEGESYHTLNAALAYASQFTNDHGATQTERKRFWIEIASGWTAQEQVILNGVDLSNVTITAVDTTVTVEVAYLEIATSGEFGIRDEIVHDFISADRCQLPTIAGVIFEPDAGTVPEDADKVAEIGNYTPATRGIRLVAGSGFLSLRDEEFDKTSITPRPGGFEGFDVNARFDSNAQVRLSGASLNDAVFRGLRNEGNTKISGSTITGCSENSIVNTSTGRILVTQTGSGQDAVFAGVYSQDFRTTPGSDSSADIDMRGGWFRNNTTAMRGGFSITPNVWTKDGYVSDERAGDETVSRSGTETLSNKTLEAPEITGSITGTAVQQSATDTTAGRVLTVGAFGMPGAITLTDTDDLNDITDSGFYYNKSGSNTPGNNYPMSSAGSLHVVASGADRATQRFVTYPGNSDTPTVEDVRIFERTQGVGTPGWSDWTEIYHQGSLVGTVSAAGGVPTGAAQEEGSNANGEYYRFASGVQICTNGNSAITTNPASFVGTVTSVDGDKLRIGSWK